MMRNRWHNGGATIEEETEDCDELNDEGVQYRALNTTLELDLGEFLSLILEFCILVWSWISIKAL